MPGRSASWPRSGPVGAWWRPDSYYRRAAWAGRRLLDGRPVVDGALVNPLAHALMQTLAIAGADRAPGTGRQLTVELERYRSRPIDVDDVAAILITSASGQRLMVAAGLASEAFIAGDITVTGTRGSATLQYPRTCSGCRARRRRSLGRAASTYWRT